MAPTPTAATTAAVAIPAQSLLLIAGRPGVMVSRGSSVAKLLLLGSVVTYGWFMVAHPGALPQAGRKGRLRQEGLRSDAPWLPITGAARCVR